MEQNDLKQQLQDYASNNTKLSASIDDGGFAKEIVFKVLFAGEEEVFIKVDGEGETTLDYGQLSHARLRPYEVASEFVEQEVIKSILDAWQARGTEFNMDTLEDVDVSWLLRQIRDDKVTGIGMVGAKG